MDKNFCILFLHRENNPHIKYWMFYETVTTDNYKQRSYMYLTSEILYKCYSKCRRVDESHLTEEIINIFIF